MSPGFAMDIINASDRDELIRIFAQYKIVPKKNSVSQSGGAKSDYIFERRGEKVGGTDHAMGTKTRKSLVKKLGIDSDSSCERVREEIKSHSQWGRKA